MKAFEKYLTKVLPPREVIPPDQNITRARQPKSQFNITDDWYKTIIQSSLEGFCLTGLQGEILDVNDSFCRMYGYSREELLSMTMADIDVDFMKALKKLRSRIMKDKEAGSASFEAHHRHKDGRIINVAVSSKYLDIKPGYFFCFHRDITEKKKMLNQLKESEKRYRALIELGDRVGEAVVMLQDIDGKKGIQTFVSDKWLNITGYSRDELLGMSFFSLLSPRYHKDSSGRHKRKLNGESIPKHFEMSIIRKDGKEIPIEVTSGYTTYKGNRANVAYIKDVTERKKIQNEIIKAEAQTKALQESEGIKTELLSMVSHELRTPLASIKGFASTLLQPDVKWSEDEKRDFILEIDTEADRLSRLVDDLLDMSSIEAGTLCLDKANCSISEILEEAKPMLAKTAEQHELKVKIASKLPAAILDKERIIQVLSNLVDNAVKFSPEGSQITIEAEKSQGKVVISVIDQGRGIPAVEQGKLFDRFYQAKEITSGVKRGTGLGLAICKGLVEAHGGRIWLESQEGKGSTFYFSLPICRVD